MNAQTYREKLSKYVENSLKSQVEDLAKDWQLSKLEALYSTLCDYIDIKTEPENTAAVKPEAVTESLPAIAKKADDRLAYGKKTEIVNQILDTFQKQAGTQKTKFAMKAEDFGMSRDLFVTKIARGLNSNPIKNRRFPDLHVSYMRTNDGAMFVLSRRDEKRI